MTTDGLPVRTGHEPPASMDEDRCRQVAQAWESLQQIRRLVQPEHPDLPAPWERTQPLRAVALAIEAAGIPFCAVGGEDVVAQSGVQLQPDEDGRVRVTWRYRRGQRPVDAGDADLGAVVESLRSAGLEALLYRAGRKRFLLVESRTT